MRLAIHLLALGLLLVPPGGTRVQQSAGAIVTNPCRVTVPNGIVAGGQPTQADSYGNQGLSTFGLWRGGTIVFKPGGPGFVTTSGALGMKFPWWRGVSGRLRIEGKRLDAPSAPLRAEVPDGYGNYGFQATYIIFPTPGCWQVTGHVGVASLTFVTRVVKIANGPALRRGASPK